MSDEQFERDLRRTLARMTAEPASPELRRRVGEVLASPRVSVRPAWRLAPRFAVRVVGVVAALAVLTAGTMIVLHSSIGPAAPADCASLTVADVSRNLAALPGYAYRATATVTHFTPVSMQATPRPAAVHGVLTGAWQAPDRYEETWAWQPTSEPGAAGLPDALVVGGRRWMRLAQFGQTEWQAVTVAGDANATITPPSADPLDDQWIALFAKRSPWSAGSVDASAHRCDFTNHMSRADGAWWDLRLEVDPATRLPVRLLMDLGGDTVAYHYDYAIDTSARPRVEPPSATADVSPLPVASAAPTATPGRPIVLPSGAPPKSWSRVPDAPVLHIAPAQGTSIAVAPDGTFVAIASSMDSGAAPTVLRSSDGLTWTAAGSLPQGSHTRVAAIVAAGSLLVAVGSTADPSAAGAVWTSTDGRAWSRVPQQPALAASVLDQLTAGPAGFLGLDRFDSALLWSGDGTTWSSVDVGTANATLSGIAATEAGFVAVGSVETTAMAWTSPDGRHWQRSMFEGSSQLNARLLSVAAQGQRLVALGAIPASADETSQTWTGLAVWTSSDGGTTWQRVASGSGAPKLYAPSVPQLTALRGGFIAFGNPGPGGVSVWSSPDGTTWRQDPVHTPAGGDWGPTDDWANALAISGSRAVIAGHNVGTGMGGDRVEFWTGDVPAAAADASGSDALARAAAIIGALGYPVPEGGTVGQEADTTTGATNTVVRYGTAWQVQWDAAGVLTFVFRTAPPPSTPAVTKDIASGRVASVAAAVGYSIPTDSVPLTFAGDLWTASWAPTVDGVPTMDDDAGITLYADGSFAGFRRLNRTLEPKPAHVLTRAEAEAAFVAARASRSSLLPVQVIDATLTWAPPIAPGTGPSPTLRLCWVLTLNPSGNVPGAKARVFLDAGTGAELWGDSTA